MSLLTRSYDIDLLQLIDAVAKRPALYDKSHPHYFHVRYKQRLWMEACQEVFPHWDTTQPQRKMKRVREIQQRWKSLRTCFTRELALQRREQQERSEGRMVKPRKIYGYFNKMSFLLDKDQKQKYQLSDGDGNTSIKSDPLERSFKTELVKVDADEAMEGEDDLEGNEEYEDDEVTNLVVEPEHFQSQVEAIKMDASDVNRPSFNYYDEDKHFLLSLVNTFRKFNDKQKIEARIEILQTLKRIQFADE